MDEEYSEEFGEGFGEDDLSVLDEIIEWLDGMKRSDEVSIINPARAKMMEFAYIVIKKVLREAGCDAKVTFGRSKQFPSFGFIEVEGVSIEITNGEWFARAAEFASNTEVYPLSGNKVRMSFGFHGLIETAPLEN